MRGLRGRDDIRDVWERVRAIVPRGTATDFWNRYREDIELARGLGCTRFPSVALVGAARAAAGSLERRRLRALSRRVASDSRRRHVGDRHARAQHLAAARAGRRQRRRTARSAHFPIASRDSQREVAQRLGNLIDDYVTLNEPDQLVYGWIKGFWMRAYAMPPGQPPYESGDAQMDDVLTLIPNLFRAHAKAREAIRRYGRTRASARIRWCLGLPRWIAAFNRPERDAPAVAAGREAAGDAYRAIGINEGGRVDFSIAQLTMTLERQRVLVFLRAVLLRASLGAACEFVRAAGNVEGWARARRGRRRHATR